MVWSNLLVRLRSSGDSDIARFADLLELDLHGFSKSGSEGTTHGAKFGDHICTDVQKHFEADIQRLLAGNPADAWTFIRELAKFFGDPVLQSFVKSCNAYNRCSSSSFRALRYVSLDGFLRYSLKIGTSLPDVGRPERTPTAINIFRKEIRRLEGGSPVHADLSNRNWNGRVWLTRSDNSSPHELALARGLSEADTCNFVAQQMGLTGYHDATTRARCIGFVALEYIPSTDMYRPTVLDALPFLKDEKVMAFYPGPKSKDHGETLPLDTSLFAPGSRHEAGVPEWIHAVERVRLRDIPAADLKDNWHCRVAWSGVW